MEQLNIQTVFSEGDQSDWIPVSDGYAFHLTIRKGFTRHETLHRQGIYFGRKVHTFNI